MRKMSTTKEWLEEVEMPGKVKVRVVAGRGLPVMDRSADTTDAFAEVIVENL